ncbi:MAG: hypothetical protein ABH869_02805 [Candidatus Omnitrophota bacterium]
MKVAMIGSWNTDSGASIHAELLGRAWIEKGVDLTIFSFYKHSFHGTIFTKKEDEDYVTRCFTVYGIPNAEMDTAPIVAADFDIFVVQDLGMIPMKYLLAIFPEIRKKSKTVNVIHDGQLSKRPEFFRFEWDHVVCFDGRYYDFLKEAYAEGKLSVIPYPAYPLKKGNKLQARETLGLARDEKIIFLFGPAAGQAIDAAMVLDRLSEKYDVTLVVVTEIEHVLEEFRHIKPKVKFKMNIIEESLSRDALYKYLHAADCMIYNKYSAAVTVVASTVYQCMGSACPIAARESNYLDSFNEEVLKYGNFYELESALIDVFEKGKRYKRQQEAIVSYLEKNSDNDIADRYLELFSDLLNVK